MSEEKKVFKLSKLDLTKEHLIAAIAAVSVMIVLGVYLIFYAPLIKNLKEKGTLTRQMENEARMAQNIIESAEGTGKKRALTKEDDISYAVSEITKYAKLKGVELVSLNPEEPKDAKNAKHRILPIKIKMRSTYKQLGEFLGGLDDLNKGIFVVESFSAVPDKRNSKRLATDLVVCLCVK